MTTELLPKKPRRVLLVMIDHHVGDFVVSIPAMHTLAAYFESPVDAVVDAHYAGIARLLPGLTDVIPYEQKNRRKGRWKQAAKFLSVVRRLAPPRYDLVIDVGSGIQSVTLTTITAARRRIGLEKSRRSFAYSRRLPHVPTGHHTDRYIPFMRAIGREQPERLRLRASAESDANIVSELTALFVKIPQRLAVIHPGAGYAFRQWPGERFAAVADHLVKQRDFDFVFIGAPGEQDFLRNMITQMSHADRARPLITKLENLIALFDRAQILISNESGPTHIAAAMDIPIVTIFGPGKENLWRPLRDEKLTILRGSFCPADCKRNRCYHDRICLTSLPVERVIDAAEALLQG